MFLSVFADSTSGVCPPDIKERKPDKQTNIYLQNGVWTTGQVDIQAWKSGFIGSGAQKKHNISGPRFTAKPSTWKCGRKKKRQRYKTNKKKQNMFFYRAKIQFKKLFCNIPQSLDYLYEIPFISDLTNLHIEYKM